MIMKSEEAIEFEARILKQAQEEVIKCEKQLRFARHNLHILTKCQQRTN